MLAGMLLNGKKHLWPYQTQVLSTNRSLTQISTTELSTIKVRSSVSILESPEASWMSNSLSLPVCTLVAIPGVVAAAALELARSMMRVSFENSAETVSD